MMYRDIMEHNPGDGVVVVDLDTDRLPTTPSVAQKILGLDMEDAFDQAVLESLIHQCPILTFRILSVANLITYRSHRPIVFIREALLRMGLKNAVLITYAVALYSQYPQRPTSRLDMNALWEHNLSVLDVMQRIAHEMSLVNRPSDLEISLAAILHDVGFVILDSLSPEKSDLFHRQYPLFSSASERDEQNYFSLTHSHYGHLLLQHQAIPDSVCLAVKHHHEEPDSRFSPLTHLLQMAESFCVLGADEGFNLKTHADLLGLQQLHSYRQGHEEAQ